jgi:hypothetical protein
MVISPRAGRLDMKASDCSGSYPSPLWGCCKGGLRPPSLKRTPMLCIGYAEGQSGGGKPRRLLCLWQPESELRSSRPPRLPLPDDAAHRLRSRSRCEASAFYLETAAEGRLCPAHKGEGSQRPHVSNREGRKGMLQFRQMRLPSLQRAGIALRHRSCRERHEKLASVSSCAAVLRRAAEQ